MPKRSLPPDKKRARFTNAAGMYLEVSQAGSKRWFLKYTAARVEMRLALGRSSTVGLTAAPKGREAAKLNKSEGRDPIQLRKVEKLRATTVDADTFIATALEWYAMKLDRWSSHYAIGKTATLRKTCSPKITSLGAGPRVQ